MESEVENQPLNANKKTSFIKILRYYVFQEKIGQDEQWHESNRCYYCLYNTFIFFAYFLGFAAIVALYFFSPINYSFGLLSQLLFKNNPINYNYIFNIFYFGNIFIIIILGMVFLLTISLYYLIRGIINKIRSCYQKYYHYDRMML